MNDSTLATVLGLLYTAANRNLGDAERVVWREALGDVRDDVAIEAARTIVREQNLWENPPTPAGFRQVTRQLATRIDDAWSLPEPSSRITPPDEGKRNIAKLRQILHDRPITKRVPDEFPLPEVNLGWGDQCPEEHHGHCGQGPVRTRDEK